MNSSPLFKTKYGYFDAVGREYVITRWDTPAPWVNVVSNGDYGFVVSQAGGGYCWRSHASLNRITRWNQDLVRAALSRGVSLSAISSFSARSENSIKSGLMAFSQKTPLG